MMLENRMPGYDTSDRRLWDSLRCTPEGRNSNSAALNSDTLEDPTKNLAKSPIPVPCGP